MDAVGQQVLILLNRSRSALTQQQFKTLRGQILAGDVGGALRGLKKILYGGKNAKKTNNR